MGEKGGVGRFGVKSRVASFRSLSCGFFPLFFPLPLSVSCSSVASLPRYFPEERARDAGIFSWRASTDPSCNTDQGVYHVCECCGLLNHGA